MWHRFTFLVLILALLLPVIVSGQSPFQTSGSREAGILVPGAIGMGVGLWLGSRTEPLDSQQVYRLDPERIWAPDRWVTRQYHLPARRVSDKLLYSSYALPLTLLAGRSSREDFGKVGLMTLQTLLLNTATTHLTKVVVRRTRPFVYNPGVPMPDKLRKNARYSFFSGHASNTASMSFLTASLIQNFYPNSDIRYVAWPLAITIPAVTGYLRMRAGKHFLTDVVTGYVVGAAIGILIPKLHK